MNPTTTATIVARRFLLTSACPVSRTLSTTFYSVLHSSIRSASSTNVILAAKLSPRAAHKRLYTLNSVSHSRTPRPGYHGTILLAATIASLAIPTSPLGEHVLGQKKRPGKDEDITSEQCMLEASRRETQEEYQAYTENVSSPRRTYRKLVVFFCEWIYEPIATTLRFLHLIVIFVPVLVTIPVIFMGDRVPERSDERRGTLWWYLFLVNSMEKAGPTFIKLGQWAASRSDIFPTEMCDLMSRLHSNVDAHPLSATKRIVSTAFGGLPFESIFVEFDETPLGIGAIAQVYKAKLHPSLLPPNHEDDYNPHDFRQALRHNVDRLAKSSPQQVPSSVVAIKVLHPKVEKMVNRDLKIMQFFATAINSIPTMEWLSLPDEVEKFGEMMRLQLDLRIEGNNLVRFRKNFKNRSTVTFPKPYLDWTTKEVLIEEFAHGIPLSAFLETGAGVYQKDIADMGLDAFLHMLLLDNFIHADLHPGNIMVRFYKPEKVDLLSLLLIRPLTGKPPPLPAPTDTNDVTESALHRLRPHIHQPEAWSAELARLSEESYQPQLIFIDTGLVTELNGVNRANFLDLFRAIVEFDGYRAGQLMIERSKSPQAVVQPDIFALKMQHLILSIKSKTFALGQVKIGDILSTALSMVRSHHVRLEGDFVNVIISILLLEGIGRALDPDLDLFKTALPMLRSLGAQTAMQQLQEEKAALRKSITGTEGEASLGDRIRAVWPMLKLWLALETREFISTSVEEVEDCVKYDLISPNGLGDFGVVQTFPNAKIPLGSVMSWHETTPVLVSSAKPEDLYLSRLHMIAPSSL